MLCKGCNYPLWRLKTRNCPECGLAFKPSDYEFVANSVQFCCPHCEQDYYGTGQNGHLIPPAFDCVRCGQHITMDEMVLLPTAGVHEEQTKATVHPWADPSVRGWKWFPAFFRAFGIAISNPHKAIDGVAPTSSARRAIIYACLHLGVQLFFGMWIFFFAVMGFAFAGPAGRPTPGMMVMGGVGFAIVPIAFLFWIAGAHIVLKLTGPLTHGWRRTVHAIGYSAGNNFLAGMPCVGMHLSPFAGLWWSITAGFMLARGHAVRGWRAALAVIIPLVIALGVLIGGMVLLFFELNRQAQSAYAKMPGTTSSHSTLQGAGTSVATSLTQMYAGGTPKIHAGELIVEYDLPMTDVLLPGTLTNSKNTYVAGFALNDLVYSGYNAPPEGVVPKLQSDPTAADPAQRVGDFVFMTKHVKATTSDGRLWMAIGWPDPSVNPQIPAEVVVISADGTSKVISTDEFEGSLVDQNELRKGANLPPIPHPKIVLGTLPPGKGTTIPPQRNPPPTRADSPAAPADEP